MISIHIADTASTEHRTFLINLDMEYLSSVFNGIEHCFGFLPPELSKISVQEHALSTFSHVPPEKPRHVAYYLFEVDGVLAGMCGLRQLDNTSAEIKKLYVRPEFRRLGLAKRALELLHDDALAQGCERIFLHTGPFMAAAHRLYIRFGFADCEPYDGSEVPSVLHHGWRFMHRKL